MYPEDYSEAKITFCHLPTSVILYSVYTLLKAHQAKWLVIKCTEIEKIPTCYSFKTSSN